MCLEDFKPFRVFKKTINNSSIAAILGFYKLLFGENVQLFFFFFFFFSKFEIFNQTWSMSKTSFETACGWGGGVESPSTAYKIAVKTERRKSIGK